MTRARHRHRTPAEWSAYYADKARQSWRNPMVRAARSASIRAAWDDPLRLAVAREQPAMPRNPGSKRYSAEYNAAVHRVFREKQKLVRAGLAIFLETERI